MKRRIFVTKPIPEPGIERLGAYGEVTVGPEGVRLSAAQLREAVAGADVLVCFVGDPIDATVLEAAAPTCRVVANYGVGTDNIDLAAAQRLGIVVTNTPDVLTDATADLAFALMLGVARQLPAAAAYARSGRWPGIEPMQIFGRDVSGKTLGIVGAGRIGTAMARRAAGFAMPVIYAARRANDALDAAGGRRLPLDDLLPAADFVSLHVPLTPETRHMIARPQLQRMKPTACLINTSRGAVIHQEDLIAALRDGVIAGAGLDVFEHEPAIPPELLDMPNVICLPHIGSASRETRERMALLVADNVAACLEGREPPNRVRP